MKSAILAFCLCVLGLIALGSTNTPTLPAKTSVTAANQQPPTKPITLNPTWFSFSLSVVAFWVSLWTWYRLYQNTKYDVADKLLQEILKIELDYPEYGDTALCEALLSDQDQIKRLRYDAFASIVWNYLETLYDKYGSRKLEKSPFISSMRCHAARHRAWLLSNDNLSYYNKGLVKLLNINP